MARIWSRYSAAFQTPCFQQLFPFSDGSLTRFFRVLRLKSFHFINDFRIDFRIYVEIIGTQALSQMIVKTRLASFD